MREREREGGEGEGKEGKRGQGGREGGRKKPAVVLIENITPKIQSTEVQRTI